MHNRQEARIDFVRSGWRFLFSHNNQNYNEARNMTVFISMLRGVNLARHNRMKMEALKAVYASLGLLEPRTFIQSGNVIFKTGIRDTVPDPAKLAKRIEDGIEKSFGFRPDVIVRTASELREVLANNPFANRTGIDPSRLLVTFLSKAPDSEAREKLLAIKIDPEELRMHGRELYIYYADGMARPKLSWPMIERTLKMTGTARNWNTVTKLLELAGELENSDELKKARRAIPKA